MNRNSGEHLTAGDLFKTDSDNRTIGFICCWITSDPRIAQVEDSNSGIRCQPHSIGAIDESVRDRIGSKKAQGEHRLEFGITEAEPGTITGGMWPRTSIGVSTVTRNIPAEGDLTNGGTDAIGKIAVEWSDGLKVGTFATGAGKGIDQ